MKKVIFSLITTLLINSCQIDNNTKDKNAIYQWILDYQRAIQEADIERLLSFVSNSVVYLPPNAPAFSGKENLRKWYLEYFNYYSPSEVLGLPKLGINGDLAYPQEQDFHRTRKSFAAHPCNHPFTAKHMLLA